MGYRPVDSDSDPDPRSVRRATFVPFLENGNCVAIPTEPTGAQLELPAGDVEVGEDWLREGSRRILMSTANFKRQRVRPFATEAYEAGLHVYAFAEGAPYNSTASHLVEIPAEELGERVDERLARVVRDAAESYRGQTDESYDADNIRMIEPDYLSAPTAEGGSGMFTATPEQWRRAREPIVDGIERDGTFLDLGCANGHLMDSVHLWASERGLAVRPYGVELAPRLAALARERLPHWADGIWVGNAATWTHPAGQRFTYVHLLLDYVLPWRHTDLLEHARATLVQPGGRLLVSHYEPREHEPSAAHEIVERFGLAIAGGSGQTVWIDVP